MPYKDKDQQRKAQHESYLRNKAKVRSRSNNMRKLNLAYVDMLKQETPCADCGLHYYPCQMDFDHLPQYTKVMDVSQAARHCSLERLKNEIAKCEIVCSNCHRLRTWERKIGLI